MRLDGMQGSSLSQQAARIIRFWRTIEALLPSAPPKVSEPDNVRSLKSAEDLPWSERWKSKYAERSDEKRWVFLVYIGIFPVEPVVQEICEMMDAADDPERIRAAEASAACIVVDSDGCAISKPSISALPWAMGQLIAMRNPHDFEARDFGEIESELIEDIEVYLQQERIIASGDATAPEEKRPLSLKDFDRIIEIICEKSGWSPHEWTGSARSKGFCQKRQKNGAFSEVEPDIINSFFINDLGRVSRSINAGEAGIGVMKFLFGTTEQRRDLRESNLQRSLLHPGLLPLGQWPSKPSEPLVLAQQIAVNLATAMGDETGMIAINGPPGTGKTTLLRDLIAAVVVRRSERLCQLKDPEDAFSGRQEVKGFNFPAWEIAGDLRGFEIVVASSNNGAVENVTKELPVMKAIAACWQDGAFHFRETADAILAPQEKLDAAGICWGLIAAALGRKENRSQFAARLWFSKPKDADADRPVSLQMALDALVEKAGSRQNLWAKAKRNFASALKQFEDYRKKLVDVADAIEEQARLQNEMPSQKERREAQIASNEALALADHALSEAKRLSSRLTRVSETLARLRNLQTARNKADTAEADAKDSMRSENAPDVETSKRIHRFAKERVEACVANLELLNRTKPSWWNYILNRRAAKEWEDRRNHFAGLLQSRSSEYEDASKQLQNAENSEANARRSRDVANSARIAVTVALESALECLSWISSDSEFYKFVQRALDGDSRAFARVEAGVRQLASRTESAQKDAERANARAEELKRRFLSIEQRAGNMSSELINLSHRIKLQAAVIDSGTLVPDTEFMAKSNDEKQKASPWHSNRLSELRVNCFLRALEVNAAFLACSPKARANLGLAVDLLMGKIRGDAVEHGPGSIWTTLSIAVPVISTTFASLDRMFEGMGSESIGWLLVDEAGQATPQAALGGIWRAKRSVIIGDPLQLEPILTLPDKAVEAIRKRLGTPLGYHPVSSSAQSLADHATKFGTALKRSNGDMLWVGCPLRVHRRCYQPMFEVANVIAYDNQMVWSTKVDKDWDTALGGSRWIDCRGRTAKAHFIEEEGQIALDLVIKCQTESMERGQESSIFVITPFRSVRDGFRNLASSLGAIDWKWLEEFTGTIHTFQGKEADFVVVLLGGDPSNDGALDWASERPNLLNVALTRARKRAYIVGNRQRWRTRPFFSILAQRF